MKETRLFSRFVRGALALVLAFSLIPTFAYAESPPFSESIVNKFATSSTEALNRFSITGNVNDLRDVDAYDGDSGGIALLANLPPKYDLRDKGVVTSVKSQAPWGTCWGFGAIAASETSIMSELGWKIDDNEIDLSELHVAWFSYTPLPDDAGSQAGEGNHTVSTDPDVVLNQGGLPFTATSVFSSGIGPVPESSVPYKNKEGLTFDDPAGNPLFYSPDGDWAVAEGLRFVQALELEQSRVLPSPASKDASGTYQYNEAGTQAIKQEISAGRAVEIAFCADTSSPGQTDPAKYINTDTWAHYTYDAKASANHAVTIVGWDDGYAKNNFLAGHQPDQDGAWIVKNSWGAKDNVFPNRSQSPAGWGIDGNGYFYLSYYDKSLIVPESFDYYTEKFGQEPDYYLIDQYDYMPSSGASSVQNAVPTSMANVFQAEERQLVRSLSCETAEPNTTVTYELYLLNDGYTNPKDGALLTTVTETYQYGGYHRIQLSEGFAINKGQHYAVVITQQSGSGYEILLDSAYNKAGMDYINSIDPNANYSRYAVGIVNKGESFLLEDGMWTDWADNVAEIKERNKKTGGGDYLDYDNFAIKAYADPLTPLVIVPDLSNMTEAEAIAALEQLGLKWQAGAAEYSDTIEAGRVIRQETAAGTEVEVGFTVTYYLSLGKDPSASQGGSIPKPLAAAGDDLLPIIALSGALLLIGALIVLTSIRNRRRQHVLRR